MIVLVGFMGAGKSTVGRLLAQRLGRPFVDSDAAVEEHLGRTVAEVFATDGELAFRRAEEETVLRLLAGDDVVLALGGGSLGSERVRAALAGHDVVHLDVSLAQVLARVGDDPARPMLRSHDVGALHAARQGGYAQVARVRVDADPPDPQVVADAVVAALAGGRPRLVVVGPPGAGTSTVGRLVADRLGLGLADVERELERRAGRSAGDVFVEDGEARFRELERAVALDLLAHADGVVVLGGAAVLDPDVAAAVHDLPVAFLDVAIADAARRIGFDRSPALVLL